MPSFTAAEARGLAKCFQMPLTFYMWSIMSVIGKGLGSAHGYQGREQREQLGRALSSKCPFPTVTALI